MELWKQRHVELEVHTKYHLRCSVAFLLLLNPVAPEKLVCCSHSQVVSGGNCHLEFSMCFFSNIAKALSLQDCESLCNMLHLQCSSPGTSEGAKNSRMWQLLSTSSLAPPKSQNTASYGPFLPCHVTAGAALFYAVTYKTNLNSYISGNFDDFFQKYTVWSPPFT